MHFDGGEWVIEVCDIMPIVVSLCDLAEVVLKVSYRFDFRAETLQVLFDGSKTVDMG